MAVRKPVVIGSDGLPQLLQPGDTLPSHARFTGTTTTAFSISLGATQVMVLTVAPAVAGDSLAAQEPITIQPTADLPGSINIAWAYPSATNTVRIGFTSSALISVAQTVNWVVTAQR